MAQTIPSVEELESLAAKQGAKYQQAEPYPHIVLDDFFDPDVLQTILGEFPAQDDIKWRRFHTTREIKLSSSNEQLMGEQTRRLIQLLNSATFLLFLSKLTGIENLIPDPYLEGGGLHQILSGGKLSIHADFNKHQLLNLDRRLNLLVYLNNDWNESYGGHFEMWDGKMETCHKRILPLFNRVVIFSTTETSYHGHPDPLTCPAGDSRKSIAMYYYTNGRPVEQQSGVHSTLFRKRPNETFTYGSVKNVIRSFVPPIIVDAAQRLRKRSD